MNARAGFACCSRRRALTAGDASAGFVRRGLRTASWFVPGAVLALLPKCPMCFAAYFALAGVSLSAASAAHLHTGLTVACAATLAVLAVRVLRRRVSAR